ncbi:MAG: hypothetical protein E2598_02120 [Sphingobium sp.]|nr:hypothetical protein [Sphingobium sp.]
MSYSIRFDGCGTTTICAPSRAAALEIAEGLRQRGRRNIIIRAEDKPAQTPAPATKATSG